MPDEVKNTVQVQTESPLLLTPVDRAARVAETLKGRFTNPPQPNYNQMYEDLKLSSTRREKYLLGVINYLLSARMKE